MKIDSTSLDYNELCHLYDCMISSLSYFEADSGIIPGGEEDAIKFHLMAAKLLTLIIQTRPYE